MIDYTIKATNPDECKKVAESLKYTWVEMKNAAVDVLEQNSERMIAPFRVQPGSPKYPLRWTSARQRAYVMAKLRRENNLPYKRTGALAAAWRLEMVVDNSALDIQVQAVNPVAYEKYVTGDYQQGFHIDTGWPYLSRAAQDVGDTFIDMTVDRYRERMRENYR